jgi:hypothetical protein
MTVVRDETVTDSRAMAIIRLLRKHGPQVVAVLAKALQPDSGAIFLAPPGPEVAPVAPTVLTPRPHIGDRGAGSSAAPGPEERSDEEIAGLFAEIERAWGEASLPDHALPYLVGEPLPLRLECADIVKRADAFAAAGALVVEPIRLEVPEALAATRPETFAIRFPSGALGGVTARIVPGGPGRSVIEFANPIELIDPSIDEAPVGEQTLMLFAFRRDGSLGHAA